MYSHDAADDDDDDDDVDDDDLSETQFIRIILII